MHMNKFEHVFSSIIPNHIEEKKIYISVKFNTAIHKCACGCGEEVVTPLSPNDWKITYDGERVSLYPSIGNWSYKCRSHYWIKQDNIVWAKNWSDEKIKQVRKEEFKDRENKNKGILYFFKNLFK